MNERSHNIFEDNLHLMQGRNQNTILPIHVHGMTTSILTLRHMQMFLFTNIPTCTHLQILHSHMSYSIHTQYEL